MYDDRNSLGGQDVIQNWKGMLNNRVYCMFMMITELL